MGEALAQLQSTDMFGNLSERVKILQPVPYQGSKRRIAKNIAHWFPDRNVRMNNFVDH